MFTLPATCTHKYSFNSWRLMNFQFTPDECSWMFMSPVTCSWIFMLPVTCSHEYSYYLWRVLSHEFSCFQWRVLMNIHITRDVSQEYSGPWHADEYPCYPWRVLQIFVTRDVFSWISMFPVTSHEYLNYTWLSHNIVTFCHNCDFVTFGYSYYPSSLYWVYDFFQVKQPIALII